MRQEVAGLVVEIKDGGRITIPKPLRMHGTISMSRTQKLRSSRFRKGFLFGDM